MKTVRCTAAQAAIRYLASQYVPSVSGAGPDVPYFAGVWAIFGHGNVAGLGDALHAARDQIPTYRAHNEQGMANAAIAFAKQMRRRRAMICTSSIGPGATNMVTSAALAHVNRLPVLFLPGDTFGTRRPDPVLQQIESFADGTVSANDCFRPVSRYFDRIARPEQLIDALPRAMNTLLDPVACGPVTLAFCQDTQTEAFDYPAAFFRRRLWTIRAPCADRLEIDQLLKLVRAARSPLIVAGGGVHYSGAQAVLASFASLAGIPVAETQGGKGALPWDHPFNLGSIGVTGTSSANSAAAAADLVIGIGTRLQDFTTGSRALFNAPSRRLVQINIAAYDAGKHEALAVVGDAGAVLSKLIISLDGWRSGIDTTAVKADVARWNSAWSAATAVPQTDLPSDAQVIGALWRNTSENAVVVCAAGGLPGELHKLWRSRGHDDYHVEYGYSCMGYEIAGGLGVKMAQPHRDVFVMVGDGSYLMLNSELATSVMLGHKLVVIVLNNRGFACINRLQRSAGGAAFNTLWEDSPEAAPPEIDFAAHAASLGATGERVESIEALEEALRAARKLERSHVIVIDTDPLVTTEAGGAWWDVAIAEVSTRREVEIARVISQGQAKNRRLGD
ncbi:MAG TPA: 3D-(3,5/4)-trihydroxycyclohexane-1,2-dione acylhydrolase (decyclizing) [Steroidobacteraceae bacterium]|nr:3D-(3,5/4)-trihydroxycyclohexane-1,2-dione acylhydrolase (decyclizing) [Steroidobacteraceae bacterium]